MGDAVANRTLVLGLGNELLSDDGVGVHAVRRLQAEGVEGAVLLDGGTLGFALAGEVAEASALVVVDAAALGGEPGDVAVFEDAELDGLLHGGGRDAHGAGLAQMLAGARLIGGLPERRALVGIQPDATDWGTDLTPTVAAALPTACGRVRELLEKWPS